MTQTTAKLITAICATMTVLIAFVYGTIAYFSDSVRSDQNSMISAGSVSLNVIHVTHVEDGLMPIPGNEPVVIMPGYSVDKTLQAENIGTLSLYIRIKLDYAIQLNAAYQNHADEIDYSLVTSSIDDQNWTWRDGYYYYNYPLSAGQTSSSLLDTVNFSTEMGNIYKDSTITLHIQVEAVQANNNGSNVFEATGWTSMQGGGL